MGKPQESSASAAEKPRKKFTKSLDPNRPSFKPAAVRPHHQHQPKSTPTSATSSGTLQPAVAATKLISGVEMPVSADGMTAEKLTADQKNVVKRGCQTMYGYRHREQHKLLKTIDAAASELSDLMKLVKERKAAAAALKSANK